MNKRDFIKSAAAMAGVSAIAPFATVSGKNKTPSAAAQQKKQSVIKKSVGLRDDPERGFAHG